MKKGIAFLLIAILVIDLTSCTSYKQLSTLQDFESYQKKGNINVLDFHSKKDSIIKFNEKFPGKMANDQVYGIRQMHFPYSSSDSIVFTAQAQNAAFIIHRDVLYKIISQDKTGFICISPDTIRVPFSEVGLMKVEKKDPLKSFLLITGVSVTFTVLLVYIVDSEINDIGFGGY
jgi:hypothetical protein